MKYPQGKSKSGEKPAYAQKRSRPDVNEKAAKGWVKRKSVWHNEHNRPPRAVRPDDEDGRLRAAARASTGPGGFLKFGDIPAHKLGRALRGRIYKIAGSLGESEAGNLAGRMKQAVTTVTASLATGFGEGTFRSGTSHALKSRGALFALQDHLEQLADESFLQKGACDELKAEVDAVVAAVNEYLGLLVKENNKALRAATEHK